MQQTNGIAVRIIRAEGIGTDQFGQIMRLMRFGHPFGAHFMQNHGHLAMDQLPSRLAARKAAANDVNGCNRGRRMFLRHGRDIKPKTGSGNS